MIVLRSCNPTCPKDKWQLSKFHPFFLRFFVWIKNWVTPFPQGLTMGDHGAPSCPILCRQTATLHAFCGLELKPLGLDVHSSRRCVNAELLVVSGLEMDGKHGFTLKKKTSVSTRTSFFWKCDGIVLGGYYINLCTSIDYIWFRCVYIHAQLCPNNLFVCFSILQVFQGQIVQLFIWMMSIWTR